MTLLLLTELIGTAAFAVSGALVGLEKQMDLFGVVVLGVTTAVGGGIIRDILLGATPPAAFQSPVFLLCAFGVSVITFLPCVHVHFRRNDLTFQRILLVMDAVGLGSFTVIGVQAAHAAAPDAGVFLASFVGVVTGIGGGVLRDVFAGNTPYVFVRHFYACASIVGGVVCAAAWNLAGPSVSMAAGAVLTLSLRLLAARFRWSLPKAH